MIVEAKKIGVTDDELADLSVLIDGFLQLIRFTADQRMSPQPAPAPPVATAAAAVDPRPGGSSPAPAAARGPRVYSADDQGVTPPVALEQRMPVLSPEMETVIKAWKTSGALDVIIDETGRVVDATIRQSMNSSFDTLLVRAARQWKYRPAMKDGVAVRYLKTLVLVP